MEELLKGYPITIEIPIAWGEMDSFRHVNNVVYIRYMESARVAYCEQLGYMKFMEESGMGPILKKVQCKFKIPLTYPDRVTVGARVVHIEEDRFTMEHIIVSHQYGKVAASGDGVLVNYNYIEGTKAPIPEEIRRAMAKLEKWQSPV